MGPFGGAIAAGVTVLTGIALAGFEAAKSLGEYGVRIRDVELRTGLTAKEVGQFGFAARAAGQDTTIFERMMRGLSEAADDTSKEGEKARTTLQRIGVTIVETRAGALQGWTPHGRAEADGAGTGGNCRGSESTARWF